MMDNLIGWMGALGIVVGLPWLFLHYITKWKQAATLTGEDEKLLDELHYTARRLDDRLATIERIIAADNPDFRISSPSTAVETSERDFRRSN